MGHQTDLQSHIGFGNGSIKLTKSARKKEGKYEKSPLLLLQLINLIHGRTSRPQSKDRLTHLHTPPIKVSFL